MTLSMFLMLLITATKEIPEDQELLHSGSVFHQRMEGRNKTLDTMYLRIMQFPLPSSLCLSQARKMLRELKYQKRCKEAVTTIAAYWHGTQVRNLI